MNKWVYWVFTSIWATSCLFWLGALFYWVPPMDAAVWWIMCSCLSGFMSMYNLGQALMK